MSKLGFEFVLKSEMKQDSSVMLADDPSQKLRSDVGGGDGEMMKMR